MARQTVLVSTMINKIKRYQSMSTVEDIFLVRDMDEALDHFRSQVNFPWTMKKGTLRVFDGVEIYPTADGHDELAYLDNDADTFSEKARFHYKTLRDFFEDPDRRNDLAEIWDDLGHKYLGIRYDSKYGSLSVDTKDTLGNHVANGANTASAETVVYKEGNGSVRVSVPANGDVTITNTFTAISDTEYKTKYYFAWVYLSAVPTSITLRYGTDSSNYLHGTVTTQFSGAALKANDWNLVAIDLNTATEEGTIDSSSFAYEAMILTGATAGTYYLDATYVRQWELLDYWYYSEYIVIPSEGTEPTRRTLLTSEEALETDAQLVFDEDFINYMVYYAGANAALDLENDRLLSRFEQKRDDAMSILEMNYPSLRMQEKTIYWRFIGNHTVPQAGYGAYDTSGYAR